MARSCWSRSQDERAVAEYVLGFVDRHGLESVTRLAIAIEGDEVPDAATLAAGLTDTVVVRIELEDGAGDDGEGS